MNTQARLKGSKDWNDYEDVTLYEAAKREAIKSALNCPGWPQYDWLVEVRRDDFPAMMVTVRTSITAEIVDPRRGAE
jgi:hypothetical protein